MIRPRFLKRGDKVLLLSPAGYITHTEINSYIKMLEGWGLCVRVASNAFEEHYRFAGTDHQRFVDMQLALDDYDIQAIICTRGGYGSIRIIDKLNFSGFMRNPKWLVGFSDITVFHSYFNSVLKCETIHAPMPINFTNVEGCTEESIESIRRALFGEDLGYQTVSHPLNISGSAYGQLVGGNLSTITSILGSNFAYSLKGKILFIEDVGEHIHNIDRMMHSLKFSCKIASLKGLIVGSFTKIHSEPKFGKTVMEIIHEATAPFGYPVTFEFPVGHIPDNYALYVGRKATLEVMNDGSMVIFQ